MRSPSSRYRIEASLGRGGMGEVFRAFDTLLKRPVALKLLRVEDDSGDGRRRLLREAQACAALRHPNVVTIYDVGEADGVTFIAMELLEGEPLRSRILDDSISLEKKLGWLVDLAAALDAAHRAGIVHRDVKPDNVLVCRDGTVRLIDFGIARFDRPRPVGTSGAQSVMIQGTPRYMAPEQHVLGGATPRSDQYAWAVLAYEVLARRHPEDDPTRRALAAARLPSHWTQALERSLSPDAEARFETMRALVAALGGAAVEDAHRAIGPADPPREATRDVAPASAEPPTPKIDRLDTTDVDVGREGDFRDVARTTDRDDLPTARDLAPRYAEPAGPSVQAPAVGDELDGRYRIRRLLGRGGMGAVYEAEHLLLGREVAVKVLTGRLTAESVARFAQEARIAGSLTSRHATRVFDVVTREGRAPYLVMELLVGSDLRSLLATRGPLPPDEAVAYALEAADALAEAHAAAWCTAI